MLLDKVLDMCVNYIYYMAGYTIGQDEANPVF